MRLKAIALALAAVLVLTMRPGVVEAAVTTVNGSVSGNNTTQVTITWSNVPNVSHIRWTATASTYPANWFYEVWDGSGTKIRSGSCGSVNQTGSANQVITIDLRAFTAGNPTPEGLHSLSQLRIVNCSPTNATHGVSSIQAWRQDSDASEPVALVQQSRQQTADAGCPTGQRIRYSWSVPGGTDDRDYWQLRTERSTNGGPWEEQAGATVRWTPYASSINSPSTNFSTYICAVYGQSEYRVRAVDYSGNFGPYTVASQGTDMPYPNPPPEAPTVTTAAIGYNSATVEWTVPTYADTYDVRVNGVLEATGETGTTYALAGLTPDTSYTVEVRAVDENGQPGSWGSVTFDTLQEPPGPPEGVAGTSGHEQVTVSWSPPAAGGPVQGYRVYRDGNLAGQTGAGALSFLDTGLTNGQTYTYTVTAFNAGGEGPPSEPATATPTLAPPGPPQSLQAVPGDAQITLSWLPPSTGGGPEGYRVYRGGVLHATVAGATFTDTGLTNGTAYTYTVTAYNAGGESGPSNYVTATPSAVPGTPQGLTATPGDSKVWLAWSPPASGPAIQGYRVYRDGILLGSTAARQFTDSTAVNGQTYSYTVTAYNAGGESEEAGPASATPVEGPAGPQDWNISLTGIGNSITIAIQSLSPLWFVAVSLVLASSILSWGLALIMSWRR
jgi:fibronectin type 3 domain-containing protein